MCVLNEGWWGWGTVRLQSRSARGDGNWGQKPKTEPPGHGFSERFTGGFVSAWGGCVLDEGRWVWGVARLRSCGAQGEGNWGQKQKTEPPGHGFSERFTGGVHICIGRVCFR